MEHDSIPQALQLPVVSEGLLFSLLEVLSWVNEMDHQRFIWLDKMDDQTCHGCNSGFSSTRPKLTDPPGARSFDGLDGKVLGQCKLFSIGTYMGSIKALIISWVGLEE